MAYKLAMGQSVEIIGRAQSFSVTNYKVTRTENGYEVFNLVRNEKGPFVCKTWAQVVAYSESNW